MSLITTLLFLPLLVVFQNGVVLLSPVEEDSPPPSPPPPPPTAKADSDLCDPKKYKPKVQGDKYCICTNAFYIPGQDKIPFQITCTLNGCKGDNEALIKIGEKGTVRSKMCKCLRGPGPHIIADAPLQPRAHWDPDCDK